MVAAGFLSASAAMAACPTGTTEVSANVCKVQGVYQTDLLLTNENTYLLSGGVFIGNDAGAQASLTIEAGTTLKGESGRDYLVVSRGSQIIAEGTADAPIVFTSDNQQRGGWGGLVINGYAPINGCDTGVCQAEGEGSTGLYGGSDPADNSGVLKYVRVEYAGYQISPDNELNGIAFQGVGNRTVVENVQVHMAADDGMEFFGGTVRVKNIVVTGARDDSLDWVNGWQGKGQYILVKQYDDEGNNGIEADNLKKNTSATPRSNPTLSNITILGTLSEAAKGGSGMLLRRGTSINLYNSIVRGFRKGCLDLDDAETFSVAQTDEFTMNSVVFSCGKIALIEEGDAFDTAEFFKDQRNNKVLNIVSSGYIFDNAEDMTRATRIRDSWFERTRYVGAVKDAASDWTKGWTVGL